MANLGSLNDLIDGFAMKCPRGFGLSDEKEGSEPSSPSLLYLLIFR